ncbi:dihydrofolate reductase family protein [Amycolatopsis rhabdoformis]|uniref:Dihydrofolate reductase family protein n=1 Tax=Amycolatopsis rhabdoformis TaxID=1448059 RepID=A0ABZ1I890_9PSEU|nr:dihydrofolate reductase family protein [Amycolatopsis rhabdoformis]WSE30560.1 dihydrofolate reductase family protein [Amycolatopsis rhabdoformis]
MGRIVNATYMTLDGDITNMAAWHWDYFGPEAMASGKAQLDRSDALIMGRRTYDGFSASWPQRAGTDEFADRMNSIDKYVVSSTLKDPEWTNSHVISGDVDAVVAGVRAVKERTEGDILQYGFGDVTRLLLAHGLLDELRVWLHPVLSGKAKSEELIYRDTERANFTFNGSEVHSTGLVILSYVPAKAAQ